MLAKLTRGNQLTIPKKIVGQSHLRAGWDYLDVTYVHGVIVLKPVDVEERIPPEAYESLLKDAFRVERGDVVAHAQTAGMVLKKRAKRH